MHFGKSAEVSVTRPGGVACYPSPKGMGNNKGYPLATSVVWETLRATQLN